MEVSIFRSRNLPVWQTTRRLAFVHNNKIDLPYLSVCRNLKQSENRRGKWVVVLLSWCWCWLLRTKLGSTTNSASPWLVSKFPYSLAAFKDTISGGIAWTLSREANRLRSIRNLDRYTRENGVQQSWFLLFEKCLRSTSVSKEDECIQAAEV